MLHRNRDFAIDGAVTPRSFPFASRSPRSNRGDVAIQEPALDPAVQQVVAELAADWSTVAADSIDDAIVEGLQRLATTLEVDHAIVWWRPSDANDAVLVVALEQRRGRAHPGTSRCRHDRVRDDGADGWPSRVFRPARDLSDCDRSELVRVGLWSLAVVPMAMTSRTTGALAVGSSDRELTWSPGLLQQLRVVAALAANLLSRQYGGGSSRVRAGGDSSASGSALRGTELLPASQRVDAAVAADRLGWCGDQASARPGRTGRANACDRAAARRDRCRQGSLRAGHSRHESAPSASDDSRELRRDPQRADRKRAVRPRARRLHGRAHAADGPLRGRQ